LHGLGIIHKDIKPDNIFIDAHGICKIGDLGGAFVLSRIHSLDHGAIKTNDRGIRTYNYSAPEIIIPIDERDRYNLPLWCYDATVDFWSLGMTIYELVVG
ncbi:kinase-like domain-containing protein, partial [Flammula alnicola]